MEGRWEARPKCLSSTPWAGAGTLSARPRHWLRSWVKGGEERGLVVGTHISYHLPKLGLELGDPESPGPSLLLFHLVLRPLSPHVKDLLHCDLLCDSPPRVNN